MTTLLDSCFHYLGQAKRLLGTLDATTYTVPHANCFGAAIGGHVRHISEHFECFLAGLDTGRVDYDARVRDRSVETCPRTALERLHEVETRLLEVRPELFPGKQVDVKTDCGGDITWATSTVSRELQFLVSHTVHHFAILGIMCHSLGIECEEGFGVAPSTLRHEREMQDRRRQAEGG
jgi:hypothetical protein